MFRNELQHSRSVLSLGGVAPLALSFAPSVALIGDQVQFGQHVRAPGLALSFAKVSLLDLANRLNQVVARVEEIEEDDPDRMHEIELSNLFSPFRTDDELNLWKGFPARVVAGMLREAATTTLQRCYELVAIRFLPAKLAKSAVKNVVRSAGRKALRHTSSLAVSQKVGVSALKAGAAYWLAVFTVNQVMDTWVTVRSRPDSVQFVARGSYSRRLALNFVRCGLGLAFFAAGAAAGSFLHPRIGTNIGVTVAPALVPLLV